MTNTHEQVQQYYGETLQTSTDLQTNACCTDINSIPQYLKQAMANIHDEVVSKYYGCGLVAPKELKGLKVLDLGCGAGRDVYLLSQLVGEEGHVVGIDMTPEQLEIANSHIDYHMNKFGYQTPNVEFKLAKIEELAKLDLKENSFDLIISNCVINLCPDKETVIRDIHRLLKPGGEMYFSDVYSDRRVPVHLTKNPVLWGECLSGALYWKDFERICLANNFPDIRLYESSQITIANPEIEKLLSPIKFFSATYRLFKIAELEDACEDFGQAVIYKGSISDSPQYFKLDDHHLIPKGKVFPVCGNTYLMLSQTRLAKHFDFIGSFENHYGLFEDCGATHPFNETNTDSSLGSCC